MQADNINNAHLEKEEEEDRRIRGSELDLENIYLGFLSGVLKNKPARDIS